MKWKESVLVDVYEREGLGGFIGREEESVFLYMSVWILSPSPGVGYFLFEYRYTYLIIFVFVNVSNEFSTCTYFG